MPSLFILLVALLALGGLLGSIAVVLLTHRRPDVGAADGFQSLRVEAVLRDGVEQTLIALTRLLEIPVGNREIGYGQLFLEQHDDHRLLVQTRSQLNRGFAGVIDITRTGSKTRVRYALIRLPADDTIRDRVRRFEGSLIAALQRSGAGDSLRIVPAALRDLRDSDSTRPAHELLPPPPDDQHDQHLPQPPEPTDED